MDIFVSIGARLREERERLGYSQSAVADLAEKAGVNGATRQSQAMYEKGQRMPDAAFLAVMYASGFDVTYVLSGQRSAVVGSYPAMKPDEQVLLDGYRGLDPATRKRLLAFVLGGDVPLSGGSRVVTAAAGAQAAGRNIVNKLKKGGLE